MIRKPLTAVALAAALCTGGAAQAALITFNNPAEVSITGDVATYLENGYTITGPAASFLPIDTGTAEVLVGGFDTTPFSLMAADGGVFSLISLNYDFYELGIDIGAAERTLTITGLLGGLVVAGQALNLTGPASVTFDATWARVSQVTFSANVGFSLDNISAVPEPGTLALTSLALLGLSLRRRLQSQRTA